jgi:hypothetical protein
MEEMARDYNGPHLVKVRRSTCNRGLIDHINELISTVSGEIVVMAAGDDISFPFRTATIVTTFCARPECRALYTDCADDTTWSEPHAAMFTVKSALEIAFNGGGVGLGAAYAYRTECFNTPSSLPQGLKSEDRILPLRASLLGKVGHISVSAVMHRDTPQSLTKQLREPRLLSYENTNHLQVLVRDIRNMYHGRPPRSTLPLFAVLKLRMLIAPKLGTERPTQKYWELILKVAHRLVKIASRVPVTEINLE